MFDEGSQATRERYGPCPSRQMGIASGGDDQRVLIWNLSNGKVYVVSDFSSKSIKSRKI